MDNRFRPPVGVPDADMTRRSFLALAAIVLASCGSDDEPTAGGESDEQDPAATGEPTGGEPAPTHDVIVVGAGPAGMTAAYRLRRLGYDVQVLEATSAPGGRTRLNREFVDFPIPLGAEWVHVEPDILDEIVDDPEVAVATELRGYADTDEVAFYDGDTVTYGPQSLVFDGDLKFVGSGWLDFFETYVLPDIADRIAYDTPVTAIDHRGNVVQVTDAGGAVHQADRVVVTVPLKLLQRRDIDFQPPLDDDRIDAIDSATVWSGFKAFIEFDEAFYPATVAFEDSLVDDGQYLYYDAGYGQASEANVLGLFSVGAAAERYQALSPDELRDQMLAELDAVFDGAASRSYLRHISQNWNDEPYARAAYLEDEAPVWITRTLSESIDDRLYFAGDAYTSFDDWSSVHTAARSAAEVVDEIAG